MQVIFTREWSGHPAGEQCDVDQELARRLIKHKYAAAADAPAVAVDLNLDDETPAQPHPDSPDTGDNTEGV